MPRSNPFPPAVCHYHVFNWTTTTHYTKIMLDIARLLRYTILRVASLPSGKWPSLSKYCQICYSFFVLILGVVVGIEPEIINNATRHTHNDQTKKIK
jgi:hypothetical protein